MSGCGIWAFHRHCHGQRIIKHCFVNDKGHPSDVTWEAECFCNQKFAQSCRPLHDTLAHCHYCRAYVCLLGFGPQCLDPNLIAKTWTSGCTWLRCMLWIRLSSSCAIGLSIQIWLTWASIQLTISLSLHCRWQQHHQWHWQLYSCTLRWLKKVANNGSWGGMLPVPKIQTFE